jgi:hypothetical protein
LDISWYCSGQPQVREVPTGLPEKIRLSMTARGSQTLREGRIIGKRLSHHEQ